MKPTPDPDDALPEIAAHLGGTLASSTTHRRPFIILPTVRARLHLATSWQPRGKWRAYLTDDTGQTFRSPDANFSPERSPRDIAQDIRRRVIEPARAPLAAHYTAQSKHAAEVTTLQQLIARLDDALGRPGEIHNHRHYNTYYHSPGFRTARESDIMPGTHPSQATHRAEIDVYSFECYLMIARLVREDRAIHARTHATP